MSANDAMGIYVWNSQLGVYTGWCDSGTVQPGLQIITKAKTQQLK